MSDEQWYYSLKTHQVVRGDQEKAVDRLGPYATREEAAAALDEVKARNEANAAWDDDPKWKDKDEEEDDQA